MFSKILKTATAICLYLVAISPGLAQDPNLSSEGTTQAELHSLDGSSTIIVKPSRPVDPRFFLQPQQRP